MDHRVMSRVIEKPTFYNNNDADQLRGNSKGDQRILFSLHNVTNPFLS